MCKAQQQGTIILQLSRCVHDQLPINARVVVHILGQKNVISAKIYHLCGAF
jgi:hypothetical protein